MIAALLLAQAAAIAAPDEVTVLGRRLGAWRGTVKANPFGTHCRTDQSTGDAALDRIGCETMLACWPAVRRNFDRAADKHLDAAERTRIDAGARATMATCMAAERRTRLAALAATEGGR